ncbi:MAG: hypothetical protein JSV24_06725 [Bacteroidales bacterium]|nr:MAG: hypothetical protein JSV24_06725 [Bacteroidales bacterium]
MKRILIIYYSQTGQLTEIVKSVTSSLKEDEFSLIFEELRPRLPYPFPWSGKQFFQVFPESVLEIPCELESFGFNEEDRFDMVILAYQIWYLSASVPFNSFLRSPEAAKLIKGKPVVTIIGSRNMWIMAQKKVRKKIKDLGGSLVGNIVLIDRAPNLISVITIIRWLIKGRREGRGGWKRLLPRAGVSEKDIKNAAKYGELIGRALREKGLKKLQENLVQNGAVEINPVLMSIEKRGHMMFRIWARQILNKGPYNDPARDPLLGLFKYYLFFVLFLVSPMASVVFFLLHKINRRNTRKKIRYYSGLS